jgi:hypothetical protein
MGFAANRGRDERAPFDDCKIEMTADLIQIVVTVLGATLVTVIVVVLAIAKGAVPIANTWLKWSEYRHKRWTDLRPERLVVFNALQKLIVLVQERTDVPNESWIAYQRAIEPADRLFPRRIVRYLQEIGKKAMQLRFANLQYDAFQAGQKPAGYDISRDIEAKYSIVRWF